jgi:acyl-CoA thioester hydrolase
MIAPTPFVTLQALRFCDTDRLGHVNNAVYSVMYEAGRAEMLSAVGLLEPADGHAVVIARIEIDFLREMNWPATVSVETALHRIGRKSFHARQRLVVDGVVTSRAASVLAIIDTTTRRAVELRAEWVEGFGRWLVPDFA